MVHSIYFYNGQRDKPEFRTFCGRVDRGINWQSSVDDVKAAYGQPTAGFSGTDSGGTWKRLLFDGIDLRFETKRWSELAFRAIKGSPLCVCTWKVGLSETDQLDFSGQVASPARIAVHSSRTSFPFRFRRLPAPDSIGAPGWHHPSSAARILINLFLIAKAPSSA